MPLKLPAPEFGTEEQPDPKSTLLAAAGDDDVAFGELPLLLLPEQAASEAPSAMVIARTLTDRVRVIDMVLSFSVVRWWCGKARASPDDCGARFR
jgi:hypothetical protein